MITDIVTAARDRRLLGAVLGDLRSWGTWLVVLKAAFAIPMTDEERVVFDIIAGGRKPPTERVSELWVIAGRRGGKSRMAALISVYLAAFAENTNALTPGETGHVMTLAPSKDQARLVRDYAGGHFAASPILRQELVSESATEIRLQRNVCLGIHSSNFRTVRGRTLLAAVLEEAAFFRDEQSATPDKELYRALLPALASTNGLLVGISTAYRKVGLLYEKHRDHFGAAGDTLVIQAPTQLLNPTINAGIIERARESDPAAALSEWDAEFRADLSSFLDDAAIDIAIDRSRPPELSYDRRHKYFAFADPSGGRKDNFTLAIAHKGKAGVVIDVIRGHAPPFDPKWVVHDFAKVARSYGCKEIVTDNYSAEWVASAFREAGIGHRRCDTNRSGLYLELLPKFTQAAITIPDHPKLIRELRLLERRTSRAGRDSVDHPQNGGSDDFANSVAGAAFLCSQEDNDEPIGGSIKASFFRDTKQKEHNSWP